MRSEGSQSFVETLKAVALDRVVDADETPQVRDLSETVLLRQLSDEGGFVRTLRCAPGKITVLPCVKGDTLEPFCAALLGSKGSAPVIMRYGSREFSSSEIQVVGKEKFIWGAKSLADALSAAGIPEEFHPVLLSLIGLSDSISRSPQELEASEIRRLAIVCSFFSKSRLLLYERPFAQLSTKWQKRLSQLMLEGAQLTGRILVVTRQEKVPGVWKSHPLVHIEREQEPKLYKGVLVENDSETSAGEIRSMLQTGRASAKGEAAFFVTRPQLIHTPSSSVPEALQAEAICNPDLTSIIRAVDVKKAKTKKDAAETDVHVSGLSKAIKGRLQKSQRRSPSGKLTRVTSTHRLRRTRMVTGLRAVLKRVSRIAVVNRFSSVLVSGRLAESRRHRELQLMLLIVILLMLILLVLNLK